MTTDQLWPLPKDLAEIVDQTIWEELPDRTRQGMLLNEISYAAQMAAAAAVEAATKQLRARVAELEQRQAWIDTVQPPNHPDDERHFALAFVNERRAREKAESRISELERQIKQMEKDHRDELRASVSQARHEERHPDEPYGTW